MQDLKAAMKDEESKVLYPEGRSRVPNESKVFAKPHLYAPSGTSKCRGRSNIAHIMQATIEQKPAAPRLSQMNPEPWESATLDVSVRVLMISDRRVTLKIVKSALSDCNVTCASTLSAANEDFNIVILETMLTGSTCVSGAEQIRSRCPNLPILCILTSVNDVDKPYIEKIQNAYILPKPFHARDLVSSVKTIIENQCEF